MTQPANPTRAIMRRTQANLRFIKKERAARRREGRNVDRDGPFDVTQLVNSFLGAFAHPFENLFRQQNRQDTHSLRVLDEILVDQAWWRRDQRDKRPSLELALGYVRNAFAHGNVEFGGQVGRDIETVRIWNCPTDGRGKNWEKELGVKELEALLSTFVAAISALPPSAFKRKGDCPQ